ncbi:hypothetical protein CCONF_10740 [Corynebacterium confusum]|nr:hypothetical protein CCONF_10740 [Corynebacterium confusum]
MLLSSALDIVSEIVGLVIAIGNQLEHTFG